MLAVAAVGGWSLFSNRFVIGEDYGSDPGPGLLPVLLLALLAVGALGLMAVGAAKLRAAKSRRPGATWRRLAVPTLLVATMLVYSQTMVPLGFLPTTLAFAVFWAIVIGIQEWGVPRARVAVLYVVEGAAITGGIYIVFAWLIKVPLP